METKETSYNWAMRQLYPEGRPKETEHQRNKLIWELNATLNRQNSYINDFKDRITLLWSISIGVTLGIFLLTWT